MAATSLFMAAALTAPGRACAQERRIGLAGMEASVSVPLGAALAPWGVVVVALGADAAGPGATMPGSAERGRQMALAANAVAVVWLSEASGGWTVWVYDVTDERVLARALTSGPPFDEPTASALALTIVSLLRHGAAAPEAERVRAPAALSPPEPRGPADEARIELGAGVAAFATTPMDVEPRLALGATYAPAAAGGALGLGLVVRGGTGLGVSSPHLSARLYDVHVLGRVSGSFQLVGPLRAGLGVDVGARVTVLDAVAAPGAATQVVRAVGLGSGWLALGLDLGPIALWLRAGALATPWPQAYLVNGAQELATEPVWGFAELALEVALR